jgi:hypothetical protein
MLKQTRQKLIARTLPGIGPACGAPAVRATGKRQGKLPPDLLHRRRALRRELRDARHEKNALELIVELPVEGESLHFVVDGRFHPCDLIPVTRRLADPAIITRLDITTLSYNLTNVQSLCDGLDKGKIGNVLLVPSRYFSEIEKPLFAHTKTELEKRGSRIIPGYVHTKLILMEISDGRCFTIEGSGNLRSCKSIEQFVMSCDRPLLEFHRGWLEKYLAEKTTYGRREGRKRKSRSRASDGKDAAGDDVDS